MSTPLVSCVIPCYNRPVFVRDAIDSALAQTYTRVEVVVVDDGSTDNTPEVLAEYGNRIRVIRQSNAGTAAARNTGIANSQGEFLAWLDSDDAWLPQKIEAQVQAFARHPDAGVIYTPCAFFNDRGEPPPPAEPLPIPDCIARDDVMEMLIVESEVMPSSCMVPRTVLDNVGHFDPSFKWEDWELHFRLARRHYKFFELPAPLTRYRVHANSKSGDEWLHARGILALRHMIEASRDELLTDTASPSMREAFRRHDIKYAESYNKVGKQCLARGEYDQAFRMYNEALRLDPRVFKYYLRWLCAFLLRSTASGRNREPRHVAQDR
jgi:glycosyltransferase involved in cell wall biosynthesis